jgi:hypothetical protein
MEEWRLSDYARKSLRLQRKIEVKKKTAAG